VPEVTKCTTNLPPVQPACRECEFIVAGVPVLGALWGNPLRANVARASVNVQKTERHAR
jgi:hypothetical protein